MIGKIFDRLRHWKRERRWNPRQAEGRHGEDLAHRYLKGIGFTVVARNYRLNSGRGEVDLIAWEGDTLVFVEVKTRSSSEFGPPDRAIGEEKRGHLLGVARDYAARRKTSMADVRFDTVAIVLSKPPEILHFRDAWRIQRQ